MSINEAAFSEQMAASGLPSLGRLVRGSLSGPEMQAERIKLVKRTAPFLSAADAQRFASQTSLSNLDLERQVAGIAGKVQSRQMAAVLGSRDREEQREIWDKADAATRKLLLAEGYNPNPDPGFFGRIREELGDALSSPARVVTEPAKAGLNLLHRIGDVPQNWNRANVAAGRDPLSLEGMAALNPMTVVPTLIADRDYRKAWTETWDGEEFILEKNREEARKLANGDERAYQYALTTATMGDKFKAIEEISGAKFGTPEYQATFNEFLGLDQDPNFQAMVRELEVGKVSMGRSLARSLGLTETNDKSSLYGIVSGAGDFATAVFLDPTLAAGKIRKAQRVATRGINFAGDHTQISERILSFADGGIDDLDRRAAATAQARWTALRQNDDQAYWAALDATPLNDFERYATVVTDHFATGRRYRVMRLDKNLAGVFGSIEAFDSAQSGVRAMKNVAEGLDPALARGFDRPSDWFRYMSSQHGMLALSQGALGGYLRQGVEMPVFNRMGQKRVAAIVRMRDQISFMAKDSPLVLQGSAELGDLMIASPGVKTRLTQGAYDVFRPFAQLTESVLNQIPQDAVLRLDDPRLATELKKVLAMGYSTLDQEFWFDKFYESTNLGVRRQVVQSSLRSMYTRLGIDATPAGREWIEKEVAKTHQAYSVAGRDLLPDGSRGALDPDSQLADAIPVPGFNEIRQMVGQSKKLSLEYMLFGSVPSSFADGFMGVWKPSVVLRLGFIPRAGGEEALAFLFRGGLRPLLEHWSTLPTARRSDDELLAPFRANARFLEWMGDASVLERGYVGEIAAHYIERAHVANQMLGELATPWVRAVARAPYETRVGQALGFDPARLEMSQQVYQYRRLQALDRAQRNLDGALQYQDVDFVDIPGVGPSRVDKDAQAMLVRARQRQLNRLQYARQFSRNPIAERIFAEEWGRVSATGGANVLDKGVDPLKDATLVVTGKNRLGRPARQRYSMRTVGGQFTKVSTNDLKSYFNAVKNMEGSRAYEKASQVAALYVDPDLVEQIGRVAGMDGRPTFQAMSDAWDALGERSVVRFAVRDYLKTGDPQHLKRALEPKALMELDKDQADWLKELFADPEKYGRDAIEAIIADVPRWAKRLDRASVQALRMGDLDLLDAVGKRELVRRLSMPDMAAQLQKMDHMAQVGGRAVERPPARGHQRVYVPMVDFETAQRLLKGTLDVENPLARAALQRITDRMDEEQIKLLIEQTQRLGRPGVIPLSGWSTSQLDDVEAVAAALSGMAPTATVGRVDVPLSHFTERSENVLPGETVLYDHELLQLTPLDQTATWNEAIENLASKLWGEYKDLAFSRKTNKPMPSIVRPLADKDFDMGHLMNARHDELPLEVLAPERVPYHENFLAQVLNKGMDEVISPAIDAMAREPMFIEAAMNRMRNAQWVRGFYENAKIERLRTQVTSTAARKTGINIDDDVFVEAQRIQFDIEYQPIEGSAIGYAQGNKFHLDQAKAKANYEAGLSLERKAAERMGKGDPPRSAAGALAWAGVDVDDMFRWFERNGGYPAYERFLIDHERAHIALKHTHNPDLEPSAYPELVGGFSARGRGGPLGDEKDKAMRAVADKAIVEIVDNPLAEKVFVARSKQRGQGILPGASDAKGNVRAARRALTIKDLPGKDFSSLHPSSSLTTAQELGLDDGTGKVIMLARNGELSGDPLKQETIKAIVEAHRRGATFVVGDMPGVDTPFHQVLNGIGADYKIYHAGDKPRVKVAEPVASPPRRPKPKVGSALNPAKVTGPPRTARPTSNMLQGHAYFNLPEGAPEVQRIAARMNLEGQIRRRAKQVGLDPDELLAGGRLPKPRPLNPEISDFVDDDELFKFLDGAIAEGERRGLPVTSLREFREETTGDSTEASNWYRKSLRETGLRPDGESYVNVGGPDHSAFAYQKWMDGVDANAQAELDAIDPSWAEGWPAEEIFMDAGSRQGADPLLNAARQVDEAMTGHGYTDEELDGISDRGRKEIEANDLAFRLNNMPFGDYVSKGDEAVLQMRMAWDSVPRHLKSEDITLAQLKNSDEVPQLIKDLNQRELKGVRMLFSHEDKIDEHVNQIAFRGAADDMTPYIDSSNVRSQFQQYVRHFMPFQFAEEQFIKRWARTFTYSPEMIRKAQLYWGGLQEMGVIENNEYGEPIFVFPGTGAMKQVFAQVSSLFGGDMVIPEASNLTGNVKYALPGMDSVGLPSTGPLVGLPMKYLSNQFPELKRPIEDFQRTTGGERSVGRSYTDQIFPTSIMRFVHAVYADPNTDKRFMVAQNATIRWMAAEDADYFDKHGEHLFPSENATAEELEQFQSRVKRWTRNNFLLQAVLGFATPTTPAFDVPDLSPEFKKLLAASGDYETAVSAFLAEHPDATPYTIFNSKSVSGYSFETTKSTAPWILDNTDILDGYKHAGAYLVPDAPAGDEFDRQAYTETMELEMRQLGAPKEIIREIYYRKGAKEFYEMQDQYEQAVATVGNNPKAKAKMAETYRVWKKEYLAQNPVFAEELATGAARGRRQTIMNEMRDLLEDDRAKSSPNHAQLAEMVQMYDYYTEAFDLLKEDGSERGRARRAQVKNAFDLWSRSYVQDNPAVEHFYLRVIRPEIRGLPELEEAAA